MKETVVVLSLLLAILATGFGDNSQGETTIHSSSFSEESTPEPSNKTTLAPTTVITSSKQSSSATTEQKTTHVVTSSATEPTTVKPQGDAIYALKDHDNYCIVIKGNISINVNYNTKEKPTAGVVTVPLSDAVHITGNCSEHNTTEQYITISFYNDTWQLTLAFRKDNGKYYQSSVSLQWDLSTAPLESAPNGSGYITNGTRLFETSTGYLCMARKTLYLNSSVVNAPSGIYTEKLHLEAFRNNTNKNLSDKYERCSEDNISNLVPIIVGACLGGLIIIVLIAYLIGRKRSRRGYESV